MSWNHLIKPSKATNTAPLPSQQLVAWAESVKAQIGSFYKENGFSRHLLHILPGNVPYVAMKINFVHKNVKYCQTSPACLSEWNEWWADCWHLHLSWLELEQQNTETQTRHNTEHPGSSSGHLGPDINDGQDMWAQSNWQDTGGVSYVGACLDILSYTHYTPQTAKLPRCFALLRTR